MTASGERGASIGAGTIRSPPPISARGERGSTAGTWWDSVSIGKVTLTRVEVGERGGSAAQGSARRGWVCCGWVWGFFFPPPLSSVRMALVRPRLAGEIMQVGSQDKTQAGVSEGTICPSGGSVGGEGALELVAGGGDRGHTWGGGKGGGSTERSPSPEHCLSYGASSPHGTEHHPMAQSITPWRRASLHGTEHRPTAQSIAPRHRASSSSMGLGGCNGQNANSHIMPKSGRVMLCWRGNRDRKVFLLLSAVVWGVSPLHACALCERPSKSFPGADS